MPSKFNPIARQLRSFEEAIRDVLGDEEIDERLTPGQLHKVVQLVYGEPAFKIAVMLGLNDNPKSKVMLDAKTYISANVALHNMLYAPLQPKDAKRKQVEQFEMEFAWMTSDEEEGETA